MSKTRQHPAEGGDPSRGVSRNETKSDRGPHRGVLLLNLGTPDRPLAADVRRYLREFLSDPDVIKLPPRWRWLNRPLGAMIALFRAPASAHAYRTIWTDEGSPLKVITEQQVAALEASLPKGWRAFYAMRYGTPSAAQTLREIADAGITDLVVIPMYPQFSGPTTGTALDDLYQQLRSLGRRLELTIRNTWYDDVGYVDAQSLLIHRFAEERGLDPTNTTLVFSTHSMPESYIKDGDPYQEQVLRSVEIIARRLGWPEDRMVVSYQSKLGPVPWLSPSTEQTLIDLGAEGTENVLVCPISFTADCLETIEELGIQYREKFEAGGGTLHLCPALNTFEPFIKTLARLTLRGPRSVDECNWAPATLFKPQRKELAEPDDVESLVMIGTSLPATMGNGVPSKMQHVTLDEFRRIKRPQEEVSDLLLSTRDSGAFAECWLWNTCSRFEFYGWTKSDPGGPDVKPSLDRAVREIVGPDADRLPLNVLTGRDAWHHLLRTAAGLNSGLPGDGEVANQMDAAHQIASRCETAGPRTEHLGAMVRTCLQDLDEHTAWARFRPEYCPVALKRVALDFELDWPNARCVVVGGSVTALSVVRALQDQFNVPDRQITVAYRNHSRGTLIKRLRAAAGNGARLRVETYRDERLLQAMADADVVVFAVDGRKPLVSRPDLEHARDLAARPLTVIDFNTFGSTENLDGLDGLRLVDARSLENAVADFSDSMMQCPAFNTATEQAERSIRRHLARILREPDPEPGAGIPCANGNGNGAACHNGHACGSAACDDHAFGGTPAAFAACPCPRHAALRTCPKRLMTERIAP